MVGTRGARKATPCTKSRSIKKGGGGGSISCVNRVGLQKERKLGKGAKDLIEADGKKKKKSRREIKLNRSFFTLEFCKAYRERAITIFTQNFFYPEY